MSDLIRVALKPDSLKIKPGEQAEIAIEVQNAAHVLDVYSIRVTGLDPDWYRLAESEVSLFPGDVEPVSLSVSLPSGSIATAGIYEFTVIVTSHNAPDEETGVRGVLEVEPSYAYLLDLRPSRVAGAVGSYSLSIANSGNAELSYDLEGSDPEGFCRFSFNPPAPVVGPGETADVAVTVRPGKRPFLEPPRTYDLTLVVAPRQVNERPELVAQLDALPRARKWYFPVALLLLIILAVAAYSAHWGVLQRSDVTYLRTEKWDAKIDPRQINHGVIYPFEFEITSRRGDAPALLPTPFKIRGDVTWPALGEVPPSVVVILKDPHGNCWNPKQVGRTADPFEFVVLTPAPFRSRCNQVDFGQLLLDWTDPDVPAPAVYSAGVALAEYCVRDLEENPMVKFRSGGDPQVSSQYVVPPQSDGTWTLFVVNQHGPNDAPDAPELTLKLKVARPAEGDSRKHANARINDLGLPPPKLTRASARCIWDDEVDVPGGGAGMQHGVVYVRSLEVTRHERSKAEIDAGLASNQAGCPVEVTDKSVDQLQWICGDVTWEREAAGSGKITASNVFIILRRAEGGAATCWSAFEPQTSDDHEGTSFLFDVANGGRPCPDELTSPRQNLWNLMNWTTFKPAQYEGVQPLVKFCAHASGQALFNQATAIPRVDENSWEQNDTPGWTLYVVNPSLRVEPPKVTVKVKGDGPRKLKLQSLPNTGPGDTPLAPPGSGTCPALQLAAAN